MSPAVRTAGRYRMDDRGQRRWDTRPPPARLPLKAVIVPGMLLTAVEIGAACRAEQVRAAINAALP